MLELEETPRYLSHSGPPERLSSLVHVTVYAKDILVTVCIQSTLCRYNVRTLVAVNCDRTLETHTDANTRTMEAEFMTVLSLRLTAISARSGSVTQKLLSVTVP